MMVESKYAFIRQIIHSHNAWDHSIKIYKHQRPCPQTINDAVAEEVLACISVNGQELATFMCSPHDLDMLALGFLYNEGLIQGVEDMRHMRVSAQETCVDVWLRNTELELPQHAIVTAGCGCGVTFDDLPNKHKPLVSDLAATPEQLVGLMKQLHLI